MLKSAFIWHPFLKQKLLRTPGDWLRPYWTEAADLDLNQHIHYVRLPAPGNKQQLHEFVSRDDVNADEYGYATMAGVYH